MKKIFILVAFLFSSSLYSQNLIQTYVDRCTGAVSVFTVPMNGTTVVSFYNKSRTFTYQEFQNGSLQAWLEETWMWWNALSPCSTAGTNAVNTTQQTQQTTQQATEAAAAATNIAQQTATTTPIPDAASTPISVPTTTEAPTTTIPDTSTTTPDTSVPDTTTSTPDTSTPDTTTSQPATTESSQTNTQPDATSTESTAPAETQSTETTAETTTTEETTTGDSTQETSTESTSETESTEVESTESTESTETESTETESTESESTESESTESESSESESESTESESDDSTESESESETESESESEETTEEESTEEESTEEESTEEESEKEESDEEQSEEEESESDEESEEDSEEESDEEESDEEESDDDEEEAEEEEAKDEDEEEDDEDEKKKRAFSAPVLAANVLSQQGPDGKYSYATMFGLSQTTLLGTETFGANLMVYDNLEQFMLNLNYSKVHINDEGRVNRVYSAAIGGMKMFSTYLATMNHSMVFLGKKGFVGGFALGTTLTSVELDIREGLIYYDDIVLAGSLTGFATKSYKWNERLTISPMVAVSSPFVTQSITNYDTTWNPDVMLIGGTNFSYMFTKRFGLTVGTTVIDATIKDFPTMVNFMIGGRMSF